MNAYLSLKDLKDELGIVSNDKNAQLLRLLVRASRFIAAWQVELLAQFIA